MNKEEGTVPAHVGIIMDGNRRWAREKGLLPFEGHRAGYQKIKEVGEWFLDAGVKILTLFTFSTENWKRPKDEVDFLMDFLHLAFTQDIGDLHKKNIRVMVIGRKTDLSTKIQSAIAKAEELTRNNTRGTLNLAISYGGRAELVDAFKKIRESGQSEITEEVIAKHIYTADLPDPDLIIRTSGEQRLSGFLLWQSAYSELYFCSRHWPDFAREDFDAALKSFAERQRRFGV